MGIMAKRAINSPKGANSWSPKYDPKWVNLGGTGNHLFRAIIQYIQEYTVLPEMQVRGPDPLNPWIPGIRVHNGSRTPI